MRRGKSLYCAGQRIVTKDGKDNWDKINWKKGRKKNKKESK